MRGAHRSGVGGPAHERAGDSTGSGGDQRSVSRRPVWAAALARRLASPSRAGHRGRGRCARPAVGSKSGIAAARGMVLGRAVVAVRGRVAGRPAQRRRRRVVVLPADGIAAVVDRDLQAAPSSCTAATDGQQQLLVGGLDRLDLARGVRARARPRPVVRRGGRAGGAASHRRRPRHPRPSGRRRLRPGACAGRLQERHGNVGHAAERRTGTTHVARRRDPARAQQAREPEDGAGWRRSRPCPVRACAAGWCGAPSGADAGAATVAGARARRDGLRRAGEQEPVTADAVRGDAGWRSAWIAPATCATSASSARVSSRPSTSTRRAISSSRARCRARLLERRA